MITSAPKISRPASAGPRVHPTPCPADKSESARRVHRTELGATEKSMRNRPAAYSTITCAASTVADSTAAAMLCAGATCDNAGADNTLCCDTPAPAPVAATSSGLAVLPAVFTVFTLVVGLVFN